MPMYLGFVWPLWDADKRTFHNMIFEARVVQATDSPPLRDAVAAPFRRRNAGAG